MSIAETPKVELLERNALIERIQALGPWHMDIQLTEDLSSGQAFSEDGTIRDRPKNKGVSLLSTLRASFLNHLNAIYPNGIEDKNFLDCACNAGGYCFWARERGIKSAIGFDVREHWITQARFVKSQRTCHPTDRIQFSVADLYDVPKLGFPKADITMFKGIFYHLPDPMVGLKIAADMTNEIMFFNTSTMWDMEDGFLKVGIESKKNVMSGVHGLKWYPTGPNVCGELLRWMGFVEMKKIFFMQHHDQPHLGRTEIVASKIPGLLDKVRGEPIPLEWAVV